MKKIHTTLLASAGLVLSSQASLVNGDILNIDYATATGTKTGAAVAGSAGDQWNAITGSEALNQDLVLGSGSNTTIKHYSGDTTVGGTGRAKFWGIGADALLNDYAYFEDSNIDTSTLADGTTAGFSQRFTIFDNGTDLSVDQKFNLTFYSADNTGAAPLNILLKQTNSAGETVYIKGETSGANFNNGYVDGSSYVTFEGISATTFNNGTELEYWIYTDESENNLGKSYALNGIQLEAIPEPATFGLFGLAGLTTIVLRRRSKSEQA